MSVELKSLWLTTVINKQRWWLWRGIKGRDFADLSSFLFWLVQVSTAQSSNMLTTWKSGLHNHQRRSESRVVHSQGRNLGCASQHINTPDTQLHLTHQLQIQIQVHLDTGRPSVMIMMMIIMIILMIIMIIMMTIMIMKTMIMMLTCLSWPVMSGARTLQSPISLKFEHFKRKLETWLFCKKKLKKKSRNLILLQTKNKKEN